VRLKDPKDKYKYTDIAFQFLLVRLKAFQTGKTDYVICKFQFLLVRLKDLFIRTGRYRISISIPFGAIKSPSFNKLFNRLITFQFLLVRLKERIEAAIAEGIVYFNSFWCD